MPSCSIQVLTGAPRCSPIDFLDGQLSNELSPAFRRFLGLELIDTSDTGTVERLSSTQRSLIKWRRISLDPYAGARIDGSPGNEQADRYDAQCIESNFFTPSRKNHDEFTEHSIQALDAIDSSQIRTQSPDGDDTATGDDQDTTFLSVSFTSISADPSFLDLDPSQSAITPNPRAPSSVVISARNVTPLSHLPKAHYLLSIRPQTMTTTLLVGIISASPTRSVSLRRGGEVQIVELTVGDETRSGFSITVWLPSTSSPDLHDQPGSKSADSAFRAQIQSLRSGDVVLVQAVALSTFRGQVSGQSLARRRFRVNASGGGTRFLVLKSAKLGTDVSGALSGPGAAIVRNRMERVARWVEHFVGPSQGTARGPHNVRKRAGDVQGGRAGRRRPDAPSEFLPPDTPPG